MAVAQLRRSADYRLVLRDTYDYFTGRSAYLDMLRDDPLAVAAVFRREIARREA